MNKGKVVDRLDLEACMAERRLAPLSRLPSAWGGVKLVFEITLALFWLDLVCVWLTNWWLKYSGFSLNLLSSHYLLQLVVYPAATLAACLTVLFVASPICLEYGYLGYKALRGRTAKA